MEARLTHVGGPTALIEAGGWRLLTDPTFDPAGGRYSFGWGTGSTKLAAPAIAAQELGPIVGDVVGFGLRWDGQEHGALWISGDTVLYDGVREVAERLDIGTALVHLGGVRLPVSGPLPALHDDRRRGRAEPGSLAADRRRHRSRRMSREQAAAATQRRSRRRVSFRSRDAHRRFGPTGKEPA